MHIMNIQQIRNATILVEYGGTKFIVDPWFQKKGTGFIAPSPYPEKNVPSPLTELPMAVEKIMDGVDAIVVTHIHPDHFDPETARRLNKSLPVFVQNVMDKIKVEQFGYSDVRILRNEGTLFKGVSLIKTPGMHGKNIEKAAGEVCGVIINGMNEKKLYIMGDTVWYTDVENIVRKWKPDIIVVNACRAELIKNGVLIMDDKDVVSICKCAPKAKIIASHMETVNHATLSREMLRLTLAEEGVLNQVIIPEDGELMRFTE